MDCIRSRPGSLPQGATNPLQFFTRSGPRFCGDCDTPLIWEGISRRFADKSIIELHVSTLDDQTLFKPDRHWFESERIGWFDIDDKLPRYSELDGPGQVPVHFGAKTD
jgi:hypothetical protein